MPAKLDPTIRPITRAAMICLAAIGLAISIVLISPPTEAAEKTAIIGKYCRDNFGPKYFSGVDRRDNGLLCSRRTSRGRGLQHYKIRAADVCAAQHRTRRFRRQGKSIICITGQGGGTRTAKTVDLKKHCRAKYGPKAFVTRRRKDGRRMCTVRTNRGRGLFYHLIDLAGLCGSGSAVSKVVRSKLHCGQATAGRGGQGGGGDAGGTTKRKTPQETGKPDTKGKNPLSKSERRTLAAATKPVDGVLKGCGLYGVPKAMIKLRDGDGETWERGGVSFPCRGLSGGWATSAEDFCTMRDFPISPVIRAKIKRKVQWKGNKPICRDLRSNRRIPFTFLRACGSKYRAMAGWRAFPTDKIKLLAVRWHKRKLRCFWLKPEALARLKPPVSTKLPGGKKIIEGQTDW